MKRNTTNAADAATERTEDPGVVGIDDRIRRVTALVHSRRFAKFP